MLRRLRLATLCLFIFSGCAAYDTVETVTPEVLDGFRAELDEMIPALLEAYAVPAAAVGIIHDGEVWAVLPYGLSDVESGTAVTDEHAFNIGSISKTVASWGVMKLVESGDLDLDTPASDYLMRWQLPQSEFDHDQVTVRRMLSHTAGLSLSGYPGFQPGEDLPSVEESLSGATNGPGGVFVAHEPGSKWQYSGGGYTVTQLIVEEITGQSFPEYMEAEVLRPLGMMSSSYVWDDETDRIAATPYDGAGDPIGGPRFTAMAAASLTTTLNDFLRFALASTGRLGGEEGTEGVLKWETVQSMQVPVSPSDDYGLGHMLTNNGGVRLAGHGGSNEGWMARLWVAPDSGHGIVTMTNGSGGGHVNNVIECLWQARITGEACRPAPEVPRQVDESVLRGYEGEYQLRDVVITLEVRDGRLLGMRPNRRPLTLIPRGETSFRIQRIVDVEFELDDAGRALEFEWKEYGEEPVRAPRID
ncbi:MAG: serine hydrolase domain-containing protein [Longimicrobiales bacterium]